jgi:hypothetical protein
LEHTPFIDPLSAATAAFLSSEVFILFLEAMLTYPYSASLLVTYYEEGLLFSVAYFAFYSVHLAIHHFIYLLMS